MTGIDFEDFYNRIVKKLGEKFSQEHPQFLFNDIPFIIYEEYMNQRNMLRRLYEKDEKSLIDRHKVCACMTVAIIKAHPITLTDPKESDYQTDTLPRVNEQLAFISAWELFKGFMRLRNNGLPDTYHNSSFIDTITRSLFFAGQLNGLSTPLIANIFFLLEKYNEIKVRAD